jgi:hypothetical protein
MLDEIWKCEFLNGSLICFLLCIYNLAVGHSLVDKLQLWLEWVAGLNHSAVIVSPLRWKKIEGKYGLDDKSTPRPIRHR